MFYLVSFNKAKSRQILTILHIVGSLARWHGEIAFDLVVSERGRAQRRPLHLIGVVQLRVPLLQWVHWALVVLSIALNYLLVLSPIIIRFALHEAERWLVLVLLLSLLQL